MSSSRILLLMRVEVPELTEEEQSDRLYLERRVERAFFEAGKAFPRTRPLKNTAAIALVIAVKNRII